MQKLTKVMALIAILGVSLIGTNVAFAEEIAASPDFQNIEILAVSAAIVGSLISVGQGIADRKEGTPISLKKVLSAVITAVTSSMLIVNLGALPDQVAGMSFVGIALMFVILGYGGDKSLSRLDK